MTRGQDLPVLQVCNDIIENLVKQLFSQNFSIMIRVTFLTSSENVVMIHLQILES